MTAGQTAPKRMSREDRHAALLDAAADLLRSAREPLTFEAIADRAGVSATLPYKYFDSVDEVANELYQRIVVTVDDATDELLATTDRSFDDKVRGALELWCDVLRTEGVLLWRLSDDAAHPSLRHAIDTRRERAVVVWAEALQRELDLADDDARLLAASITAGSTAALRRWIVDRLDRHDMIERFVVLARAQIEAMLSLGGSATPPSRRSD